MNKIINSIVYNEREFVGLSLAKLFYEGDEKRLNISIKNYYSEKLISLCFFLELYDDNYQLLEVTKNTVLQDINIDKNAEKVVENLKINKKAEFVRIVISFSLFGDLLEINGRLVFPIASVDFIERDNTINYQLPVSSNQQNRQVTPNQKTTYNRELLNHKTNVLPSKTTKRGVLFYLTLVFQLLSIFSIFVNFTDRYIYNSFELVLGFLSIVFFIVSLILTLINIYKVKKPLSIISFIMVLLSSIISFIYMLGA